MYGGVCWGGYCMGQGQKLIFKNHKPKGGLMESNRPFFTVDAPDNLPGQMYLLQNKMEREFWSPYVVEVDFLYDKARELSAVSGYSTWHIANQLVAYALLEKLPLLKKYCEETNHLDAKRLNAIADAVDLVARDEPDLAEFDRRLVRSIKPHRQNQALNSPSRIKKKAEKIIKDLFGVVRKVDDPKKVESFAFDRQVNTESVGLWGRYFGQRGIDFQHRVEEGAKKLNTTLADALYEIVVNNVTMKVVLNTYGKNGVAEYADPAGDLPPEISQYYTERISATRDMDAVPGTFSAGYHPSDTIKAFVRGRDGTCRFPGCDEPAWNCEIDHVQDYEGGGPTEPGDLECLCHKHHCMKTLGLVQAMINSLGIVTWFFTSGRNTTTVPGGPLAGLGTKMGYYTSFTERREWLFKH